MGVSILLILGSQDPHGLLSGGPCGARPPTANWCSEHGLYKLTFCHGCDEKYGRVDTSTLAGVTLKAMMESATGNALVLQWDDIPVPEGCWRVAALMRRVPPMTEHHPPPMLPLYSQASVLELAQRAEAMGFGKFVSIER